MKDIVISDVCIVTPSEVVEHVTLIVSNGRIVSIQSGAPDDHADAVKVDGRNRLLLPGLIDLHNDGIEQELEPRPRARFPLAVALQAVFRLVKDGFMSLPDAVRMASLNPARATGLDTELGTLSIGKRADMILVNTAETPSVVGAWVGGHKVYEEHDGSLDVMGDQWAAEANPRSKEKADAL
jgi:alpha-D-ribose 1-methylphosphonate 5-triphosphate diphosphatase PhnM